MVPRPFRVLRARRELGDVRTLDLAPADGGPFVPFRPGQFNMLYAFGVGEVPISISGDPARSGAYVHTIRAVGAVTRALCATKPGVALGLRGPFGSAWPLAEAEGQDLVFIAGGLGLAPLRPALYEAVRGRTRFGRISLLVGARHPGEILFAKELERWRRVLDVRISVDRADAGWTGHVGVVTTLIPGVPLDPLRTRAFICGPEIMMRYAAGELSARGVPGDAIFVSMERNMKCAIGVCGHCQFGPAFICKDGPKFPWTRVEALLRIREL